MKTQEVKKNESTKKRFSLVTYIKETIAGLKRVTWSTKTELLKNTGIVLATIISFTILVWALDTLLSGALALIINRKEENVNVRNTRSKMVCSSYLFRT